MLRRVLLSLATVALVGGLASAQMRVPVYCGSFTCFYFRVAAEGKEPEARASAAMDVINKYLGGKACKVSMKPAGKNIKLFLNNEFIAVVTPEDAAAEKQKKVQTVAARWGRLLTEAFDASKAQK